MTSETAVGYIRLSQDGNSLDRQRRDVEDYAANNSYTLAAIYNEATERLASTQTEVHCIARSHRDRGRRRDVRPEPLAGLARSQRTAAAPARR